MFRGLRYSFISSIVGWIFDWHFLDISFLVGIFVFNGFSNLVMLVTDFWHLKVVTNINKITFFRNHPQYQLILLALLGSDWCLRKLVCPSSWLFHLIKDVRTGPKKSGPKISTTDRTLYGPAVRISLHLIFQVTGLMWNFLIILTSIRMFDCSLDQQKCLIQSLKYRVSSKVHGPLGSQWTTLKVIYSLWSSEPSILNDRPFWQNGQFWLNRPFWQNRSFWQNGSLRLNRPFW